MSWWKNVVELEFRLSSNFRISRQRSRKAGHKLLHHWSTSHVLIYSFEFSSIPILYIGKNGTKSNYVLLRHLLSTTQSLFPIFSKKFRGRNLSKSSSGINKRKQFFEPKLCHLELRIICVQKKILEKVIYSTHEAEKDKSPTSEHQHLWKHCSVNVIS